MFKDFFAFLRHPAENVPYTCTGKELLRTFLLYVIFTAASLLVLALIVTALHGLFPDLIDQKIPIGPHRMHWAVTVLLGPFLEECAFRLPLRRYKAFLFLGLTIFSFFILSLLAFSHWIYCLDFLLLRIGLAIPLGALLYVLLHEPFTRCRFGTVFYVSAVVFGLMHIANARFEEFLPLDYLFLLLYVGKQALAGILFGYARLRHGFPAGYLLHMLNNAI